MSTQLLAPWVSVEAFHANPRWEHFHYLQNGEVRKDMGTAHPLHERLKAVVIRLLTLQLINRPDVLVWSETAYQFDAYTLLIPDVSIMWPPRKLEKRVYPQGAPELAIEILSPANTTHEYDEKARIYWAHGAQAVWVLDPENGSAFSIDHTGRWNAEERLTAVRKAEQGELRVEIATAELSPE